ncbi:Uncharacterized protein DBV15_05999 [Temnothorax longispinosus]|uniref:Uncharacterized protein n=1 Tax=Temnothorax longispinosus TaxID=300112 RepID=A0A4S2KIX1_9HYME|nr:Uncharacterized protein DBV15_05999 [Temnothorax longispinosus]
MAFPRSLLVALPSASIAQFADTSLSIGWVGGPSLGLWDPRARWSGSDPGRSGIGETERARGSSFCTCPTPPTRTVCERERFQPADDDRLKKKEFALPQVELQ